jgi:hypothetical protein
MSKPENRMGNEEYLEQRAFETLNKQIHQFEEPSRTEALKKVRAKHGNQGKPLKLAISFKLENGKVLKGFCVNFDNPRIPKSRLVFPTGQKRTDGGLKELGIPCQTDARIQGNEAALMKDANDFLRDIHEQALSEFPEWLAGWGCGANENNPRLSLYEIRKEWKYKKAQFEIFRLAAQAGFFTNFRPLDAERPEIVEVELNPIPC